MPENPAQMATPSLLGLGVHRRDERAGLEGVAAQREMGWGPPERKQSCVCKDRSSGEAKQRGPERALARVEHSFVSNVAAEEQSTGNATLPGP